MDRQTRLSMAKNVAISTLRNRQLILEQKADAERNGNKRLAKKCVSLLSDIDKLIRDYGLNRYAEQVSYYSDASIFD